MPEGSSITSISTSLHHVSFQTTPGQGSSITSILPIVIFIVLIFAMMYFLMIRPQRRRQKEQEKITRELRRGDKVVTSSGIYGQIESITENSVVLKIESGATIRVARGTILGKQTE